MRWILHGFAVIAFAFGLMPTKALAQDIDVLYCSGCNSTGMRNFATSLGIGEHYIWNPDAGLFAAYDVDYEDTVPRTLRPRLIAPNAATKEMYDNLLILYKAGSNSFERTITVQLPLNANSTTSSDATYFAAGGVYTPKSKIVATANADDRTYYNAYDVVTSSQAQNIVSNALQSDFVRLGIQIRALIANGIVFWRSGNDAPVSATTNVLFDDGSRAVFKWDFARGVWAYVKGTAIDSSGNRIPESAANVAEIGAVFYLGNQVAFNDWVRLMVLYGINVQASGIGRYVCTSAGNAPLQCVREPY